MELPAHSSHKGLPPLSDGLAHGVANAKADAKTLDERLASCSEAAKELKPALNDLGDQLSKLEEASRLHGNNTDHLHRGLESLRAQVERLGSREGATPEEVEALKARVDHMSGETRQAFKVYDARLMAIQGQIAPLLAQAQVARDPSEPATVPPAVAAQLEELSKRLTEQQAVADELGNALQELRKHLSDVREAIKDVDAKVTHGCVTTEGEAMEAGLKAYIQEGLHKVEAGVSNAFLQRDAHACSLHEWVGNLEARAQASAHEVGDLRAEQRRVGEEDRARLDRLEMQGGDMDMDHLNESFEKLVAQPTIAQELEQREAKLRAEIMAEVRNILAKGHAQPLPLPTHKEEEQPQGQETAISGAGDLDRSSRHRNSGAERAEDAPLNLSIVTFDEPQPDTPRRRRRRAGRSAAGGLKAVLGRALLGAAFMGVMMVLAFLAPCPSTSCVDESTGGAASQPPSEQSGKGGLVLGYEGAAEGQNFAIFSTNVNFAKFNDTAMVYATSPAGNTTSRVEAPPQAPKVKAAVPAPSEEPALLLSMVAVRRLADMFNNLTTAGETAPRGGLSVGREVGQVKQGTLKVAALAMTARFTLESQEIRGNSGALVVYGARHVHFEEAVVAVGWVEEGGSVVGWRDVGVWGHGEDMGGKFSCRALVVYGASRVRLEEMVVALGGGEEAVARAPSEIVSPALALTVPVTLEGLYMSANCRALVTFGSSRVRVEDLVVATGGTEEAVAFALSAKGGVAVRGQGQHIGGKTRALVVYGASHVRLEVFIVTAGGGREAAAQALSVTVTLEGQHMIANCRALITYGTSHVRLEDFDFVVAMGGHEEPVAFALSAERHVAVWGHDQHMGDNCRALITYGTRHVRLGDKVVTLGSAEDAVAFALSAKGGVAAWDQGQHMGGKSRALVVYGASHVRLEDCVVALGGGEDTVAQPSSESETLEGLHMIANCRALVTYGTSHVRLGDKVVALGLTEEAMAFAFSMGARGDGGVRGLGQHSRAVVTYGTSHVRLEEMAGTVGWAGEAVAWAHASSDIMPPAVAAEVEATGQPQRGVVAIGGFFLAHVEEPLDEPRTSGEEEQGAALLEGTQRDPALPITVTWTLRGMDMGADARALVVYGACHVRLEEAVVAAGWVEEMGYQARSVGGALSMAAAERDGAVWGQGQHSRALVVHGARHVSLGEAVVIGGWAEEAGAHASWEVVSPGSAVAATGVTVFSAPQRAMVAFADGGHSSTFEEEACFEEAFHAWGEEEASTLLVEAEQRTEEYPTVAFPVHATLRGQDVGASSLSLVTLRLSHMEQEVASPIVEMGEEAEELPPSEAVVSPSGAADVDGPRTPRAYHVKAFDDGHFFVFNAAWAGDVGDGSAAVEEAEEQAPLEDPAPSDMADLTMVSPADPSHADPHEEEEGEGDVQVYVEVEGGLMVEEGDDVWAHHDEAPLDLPAGDPHHFSTHSVEAQHEAQVIGHPHIMVDDEGLSDDDADEEEDEAWEDEDDEEEEEDWEDEEDEDEEREEQEEQGAEEEGEGDVQVYVEVEGGLQVDEGDNVWAHHDEAPLDLPAGDPHHFSTHNYVQAQHEAQDINHPHTMVDEEGLVDEDYDEEEDEAWEEEDEDEEDDDWEGEDDEEGEEQEEHDWEDDQQWEDDEYDEDQHEDEFDMDIFP